MSVGTGTVGSGTQIKYVSWGAGDTAKDIFDGIASIMTASGGWTISSSGSGTFYNTYYGSATTDFRRVYQSTLLSQGSNLSIKYVMLRITTTANITVGGTSTAGFYRVQLIPFQSWSQNGGNDLGTNQAGMPLINNQATYYGYDADFLVNTNEMTGHGPCTIINNGSAGLLYVGFASNAAYLVMWPYYSVNGQLFNSQRVNVLVYGEVSEDVAAYTNCPPVYVTTLQRLSGFSGVAPTIPTSLPYVEPTHINGTQYTLSTVFGANNTAIGAPGNLTWYYTLHSYAGNQPLSCGAMWLSPCAPGSTTGYKGVSDILRTGPQASAFQRMTMGHMGEYGFTGASLAGQSTYSFGSTLINGLYPATRARVGGSSNGKYAVLRGGDTDTYNTSNTHVHAGMTALNSTNFKGIEPIFGGGITGAVAFQHTAFNTAYFSNPFPLMWQWGRIRGLKYVGAPSSPAVNWSTLDTVSMTVDADGFYTKTGGTATTFALIGFAPFSASAAAIDGDSSPVLFWAIPA